MSETAIVESNDVVVGSEALEGDRSVRRFVRAVAIGWIAVTIPYLWFLTDFWNHSPSLLRTVLPNGRLGNFYDLQARAMFHGHLYVPNGSLGLEAWVHDGRQYTYYGIFPSLLRMPFLLVTHSLDGRLSAPSILLAWLVTGTFSALVIWRVRVMMSGHALLGRAETVSYGIVMAVIMGGSVLLVLAAYPWVYTEDIAWSSALTIGAAFAILGVLESPSWRRITGMGVLILASELTRGTAGLGCVIGAVLAALWLASGRAGKENRRWWLPVLIAGAIPLCAAFAVSWLKFGSISSYPLHDQLYYQRYLAKIKGTYFSPSFIPTAVAAYFAVPGLHFSTAFPFITLPSYPATAVGNVTLFGTEEVAGITGSMPLLFVLALWGAIVAFLPRAGKQSGVTVIPLIVAAAPGAVLLVFGFLTERFVGDFVPLLIFGTALGVTDLWNRLQGGRRRRLRVVALGLIALFGIFGIGANVALVSTPTGWWSNTQTHQFVEVRDSVGRLIGKPLTATVVQGQKLPASAPLFELVIERNCAGFYIKPSTGYRSWLPVESAPGKRNSLCHQLLSRR